MYSKKHYINQETLKKLQKPSKSFDNNEKTRALYKQQRSQDGFPLLKKNLLKIKQNQIAKLTLKEVDVHITLNKTRKGSIVPKSNDAKENRCKLCELPEGQKGFPILNNKYFILTNPGVTIPGDLTIPAMAHENQEIKGRFQDMLDLSEELYDYSIFYNGLRAGASSSHCHFQAGLRDKLPTEKQFNNFLKQNTNRLTTIKSTEELKLYKVNNYLRVCYLIISDNKNSLLKFFNDFYEKLVTIDKQFNKEVNISEFGEYIPSIGKIEEEPRMNLMLKYLIQQDKYLLAIFPKRTNRPKSYYRENEKILLGMGIKESLGTLITCRLEDFYRLRNNPLEIKKAYEETSITKKTSKKLDNKLK